MLTIERCASARGDDVRAIRPTSIINLSRCEQSVRGGKANGKALLSADQPRGLPTLPKVHATRRISGSSRPMGREYRKVKAQGCGRVLDIRRSLRRRGQA